MIGILLRSLGLLIVASIMFIPVSLMFDVDDKLKPDSRWRLSGKSYKGIFEQASLFALSVVGFCWLWNHAEVLAIIRTSPPLAGSAVVFIVAFTLVVPVMLVAAEVTENNFKPESYAAWLDWDKSYKIFLGGAATIALGIVGLVWWFDPSAFLQNT